jgi:twitching motility protein PilT
VETSEFSGASAADEPQPAADFGFFTPVADIPAEAEAEPTPAWQTPPNDQPVEQPTEMVTELAPSALDGPAFAPEYGDPVSTDDFGVSDGGSALLAPETPEPASMAAGLPMSLTIAAEEAATVDVDAIEEPTVSPYESFHSEQPAAAPEAEVAAVDDAGVDPDYLAATAPTYESDLAGAYATEDPTGMELQDSEAEETAYSRVSTEPTLGGEDIVLVDLLLTMLERGASDLHITAGARPAIRVNGELEQMDEFPVLTPPVIQRVMYAAITQRQREQFEEVFELDFAYSVPGRARFRVNMYRQRDAVGAAFRIIPFEIKKLEDLGVPQTVANFAMLSRGFVLVTGPTGSGKSTTLASVIDLANRNRKEHIMTCEDPIEFLHRHQSCLVNQREVGEDTKSFQNALKHVLRQDPDIILVGEMRDLETISVALTAAETGHLVFATLHTQDAAQTIDRVIDVFPPHQQQQVRAQLATAIQGVVCQTLARTVDGKGRVVACEVMVATPAIRNLIREGKTHQIYSSMQAGSKYGMQTMDQHLADLVNKGRISYDTGVEKCHHIEDFNRLTGRG